MSDAPPSTSDIGWVADIEAMTIGNDDFRPLFTSGRIQLTVMSLAAGESIGWEMHDHLDQFLRIERGTGTLKLGRSADDVAEKHAVCDDWAMIIPAGTWHDVVNEGDAELKLYSHLRSPVITPDGTVHRTEGRRRSGRGGPPRSLRVTVRRTGRPGVRGWQRRSARRSSTTGRSRGRARAAGACR